MTIADDGSTNSGWVYDPKPDQNVWRYGTERPCNLIGRYVTIVADYSAVQKPFEIALCHWGILGNREPIPDEVEEEVIVPTFAEDMVPQYIVLG